MSCLRECQHEESVRRRYRFIGCPKTQRNGNAQSSIRAVCILLLRNKGKARRNAGRCPPLTDSPGENTPAFFSPSAGSGCDAVACLCACPSAGARGRGEFRRVSIPLPLALRGESAVRGVLQEPASRKCLPCIARPGIRVCSATAFALLGRHGRAAAETKQGARDGVQGRPPVPGAPRPARRCASDL